MLIILIILFYCIATSEQISADEYKVVKTRFGSVRGKRLDTYGGQSGFVFAGIPEARPPVGELSKTYKIHEEGKLGPVSEDCLYLNVFASRTCLEKGGCPIMVVYHGGVFKFESPVIFRMDTIINNFANDERNIIVATVPYRYGAIGVFHLTANMKTSIDDNIGIKDCIFGLQWIQREIIAFGGDPNKVTLYGHSAGGAITTHLAMLPATEGLFQQFISQSGPIYVAFEYTRVANIQSSRVLVEIMGCAEQGEKYEDESRVEEIIKCMRLQPEQKLLEAYMKLYEKVEDTSTDWIDGPGGILPTYQKDLIKKVRKIAALIGTVTAEFRFARYAVESNGKANLTRLTELCTHYAYNRGYHEPEKFINECKKYYSKDNMTQYLDDHFQMYAGTAEAANAFRSAGANVYVYSYDYWGEGEIFKKYSSSNYLGPSHSEDYVYIFGLHRDESKMKPKDFQIERIYTGMIANFVRSGDPSYNGYKWNSWENDKRNYFLIDFDENLMMPGERNDYYLESQEFWENTVPQKVGDFSPLATFPKKMDVLTVSNLLTYIVTAWMAPVSGGSSFHHDKTFNASMEAYNLWTEFVRNKQKDFLAKEITQVTAGNLIIPDASENLENKGSGGINWLTLSLVVTIVLLVGYIAFMKFSEYRRRKDYSVIVN